MGDRKKAIIIFFLVLMACASILVACSRKQTAAGAEMMVADWNGEEAMQGEEAFAMVFAGNTSLQNSLELSENHGDWQILVENTGTGKIAVEIGGYVFKVEPGDAALIYSTQPWAAGTYSVSFSSASPEGMQGKAVCRTIEK